MTHDLSILTKFSRDVKFILPDPAGVHSWVGLHLQDLGKNRELCAEDAAIILIKSVLHYENSMQFDRKINPTLSVI